MRFFQLHASSALSGASGLWGKFGPSGREGGGGGACLRSYVRSSYVDRCGTGNSRAHERSQNGLTETLLGPAGVRFRAFLLAKACHAKTMLF